MENAAKEAQNRRQSPAMGALGSLPVFLGLGFYAVAAQTLLFREFLTAFEGNELGVGSFFGSWLLWVAVGAIVGRATVRWTASEGFLSHYFPLAVLLYMPAFILQFYLIFHARALVGVRAYELFPFIRMTGLALVVNAPVSFLSGLFFTTACPWVASDFALPVARVYIVETLGAFLGGVTVTVLLARGMAAESVFLVSSLALACFVGVTGLARAWRQERRKLTALPLFVTAPLILLLALVFGLGTYWADRNARTAWARLLPIEAFQGRFTTAQAPYLYGEREGQFIVMSAGGVCETLPDIDHASEVVALNLAQHPLARRILVMGPGSLGICLRFRAIPGVESVTWLHPDPEYGAYLAEVLPESFRLEAAEVEIPEMDPAAYLRTTDRVYDLAVLNLPDVTTLVLNRYSTVEFFALLKRRLAEYGVVSMRVTGAANYLGGELAYLGSSALRTLEVSFANVALKPGDDSWLIASDGRTLTESAAELRDRFAAIEGAAAVFPPEGLFTLYPLDRIAFQRDAYRHVAERAGDTVLLNTDAQPKALLFTLASAVRRATGLATAEAIPAVLKGGSWVLVALVLAYGLVRIIYAAPRHASSGPPATFDAQVLVLTTGMAAMSLSIVLMFAYQLRFGSLFLHVGLLTSLFMFGAFLGGLLSEHVMSHHERAGSFFLAACLAGCAIPVVLILGLPADATRLYCAFLFVLSGTYSGLYFPIAAYRLRTGGKTVTAAGANLEMADHIGGAAGGVLTGLVLLPLLGTQATLVLLYLVVAVSGALTLGLRFPSRAVAEADRFDQIVRPAGYTVVWLGAVFLLASQILARAGAAGEGERLAAAARAMAGATATQAEADSLAERATTLSTGGQLPYYVVEGLPDVPDGFVFPTRQLAPDIYGYGGPFELAVYIEKTGILREVRVLRSNETPAYLDKIQSWMRALSGRNLFEPGAFESVDAVSGATLTSAAIRDTLAVAGPRFGAEALGLPITHGAAPERNLLPDRNFLILAALTLGAIVLRYRPRRWVRRAFLLTVIVVAGLWANLQYSSQQVLSLLGLGMPPFRLDAAFFLVVLVPVLVLLFGNVYCGSLCPFGAFQELVGDLRSKDGAMDPPKSVWRYGRMVKYLLLLLLVVLFSVTRDFTVLAADPLITVFGVARDRMVVVSTVILLVLAVMFRRFWCRNLCPAGAFLALLNGVKALRSIMPATNPARCDLGVRAGTELDCIQCDRCRARPLQAAVREPFREVAGTTPLSAVTLFLVSLTLCGLVFSAKTLSKADQVFETRRASAVRVTGSAGQPRDVDPEQIKALIRRGLLSDREAEFYRPAQTVP